MKILEQNYTINAPVESVWRALTKKADIEVWSGSDAKMDDKEGTEFSLWGGDIHGKNLEVTENDELVQEWFGGKWEKPSKVTFTLTQKNDKTVVNLLHESIPDDEYENIEEGWKEYYMGPLQEYVEVELA